GNLANRRTLLEFLLLGVALDLWGFFLWASWHSGQTGDFLFFRASQLQSWQYPLAYTFRLFREDWFVLGSIVAFVVWLFIILKRALKVSFRSVLLRLFWMALFLGGPAFVIFSKVHPFSPFGSADSSDSVWELLALAFTREDLWKELAAPLLVVFVVILVSEILYSVVKRRREGILKGLGHSLLTTLYLCLTAGVFLLTAMYFRAVGQRVIGEFSDYFVRLPAFFGIGLAAAWLAWSLNALRQDKAIVVSLRSWATTIGVSALLLLPAALWIYHIHPDLPDEKKPRNTGRTTLHLSESGMSEHFGSTKYHGDYLRPSDLPFDDPKPSQVRPVIDDLY
ncbi:MAG: hypothetical protein ACRD2L_08200, partial [Terriglobia bacterium]